MRKTFILLTPLLLAGCIKQSNSYYVGETRDHAITVRAEQEYFWSKDITLSVVVARLPDCQRAYQLLRVPADDVAVELFSNGDDIFTIRSDDEVLQVDAQACAQRPSPPQTALGTPVGIFRIGVGAKMDYETVTPPAGAPLPATPPKDQ